jgi:hypothetical protein
VDDRPDRHLGRDVASDTLPDALHPLLDDVLGVELLLRLRRGADVAGDGEHLLEPLAFVQALGEPQPSASDAR